VKLGAPGIRETWSTGRGLNPRIQVLQTCALATSPPVPERTANNSFAALSRALLAINMLVRVGVFFVFLFCTLKFKNPPRW
jgi:hypothetical protein